MGNVYAKPAVDFALAQVGKDCGKKNHYSAELDAIEFYNYPKNGDTDSCSIFVDRCVYEGAGHDKWDALNALCEPQSKGANAGAGCSQAIGYFKAAGCYETDPGKAERGDKIFYKDKAGRPYHTGIVVDWGTFPEGQGFQVVEGNTNGGKVAKKFVAFSDPKIHGFGKVRYDAWEAPSAAPEAKPEKVEPETPAAPTAPAEAYKCYRVIAKSGLKLRKSATTQSKQIGYFSFDDKLLVKAEVDGEGGTWLKTSTNGPTGYVMGKWCEPCEPD